MCDFHSACLVRATGEILHLACNSHSAIAMKFNLGRNEAFKQIRFFEIEWNARGEVPALSSVVRNFDQLPPKFHKKVENYLRNLKKSVETGELPLIWAKNPEYQDVLNESIRRGFMNGCCIDSDGTQQWHKKGKLHRDDDKPAVEYADGTKFWYQNGKLHRDNDKPAVECADGTKFWYQNGQFHRDDDKPAIERAEGGKEWYKNGKLHRDGDKPAVEYANGNKYWYQNGQLHRDGDKPAVIYPSGKREFYYKHDVEYFPKK